MSRMSAVPRILIYELYEVDPAIMVIECIQAPHRIVWFVRRASTHPTESLTQLLEGVILPRDNVFSPALPHEFLIHRAYRRGLPQGK
eukprot:549650-Pyramimonas_sp.AAC.1